MTDYPIKTNENLFARGLRMMLFAGLSQPVISCVVAGSSRKNLSRCVIVVFAPKPFCNEGQKRTEAILLMFSVMLRLLYLIYVSKKIVKVYSTFSTNFYDEPSKVFIFSPACHSFRARYPSTLPT